MELLVLQFDHWRFRSMEFLELGLKLGSFFIRNLVQGLVPKVPYFEPSVIKLWY